jgi:hypothetical protein
MKYLECPDLTENKFVSFYTAFNSETYRLTFKWNEYCDCCFLSIYDSNGDRVDTGNALVANGKLVTDKRKIPTLYFRHKDGLTLEPTAETIGDYILIYEDTGE